MMAKCPGSGTRQMLNWLPSGPSSSTDGKPYPGASVCNSCSGGIVVLKGSVRKATSQSGYETLSGVLRVHRRADR